MGVRIGSYSIGMAHMIIQPKNKRSYYSDYKARVPSGKTCGGKTSFERSQTENHLLNNSLRNVRTFNNQLDLYNIIVQ